MRVLGKSQAAEAVASALGMDLDAEARPDERYVVVLEGDDALESYEALARSEIMPLALVAWCVPSAVLTRLAPGSPPLVVGCPSSWWQLQAALDRGNDTELIAHLERMARLEARLAGEAVA